MKLLIEIGVEELPAVPFLKEFDNILPKWNKVLDKFEIKANFKLDFTPRRFVLSSDDFPEKQNDKLVSFVGAPKHVALKDGKFTNEEFILAIEDIINNCSTVKEIKESITWNYVS